MSSVHLILSPYSRSILPGLGKLALSGCIHVVKQFCPSFSRAAKATCFFILVFLMLLGLEGMVRFTILVDRCALVTL